MQDNFWKNINGPILALAPMEDVTDTSFRESVALISEPGCLHVLFTEFTAVDRMNHPLLHTRLFERNWGHVRNLNLLKRFYKVYTHGFPDASKMRAGLMSVNSFDDVYRLVEHFLAFPA